MPYKEIILKEETQKVLKEEMGYIEEIHQCSTCFFYKEIEDPYLDRSWLDTCNFNSIGSIDVKKTASCEHWRNKRQMLKAQFSDVTFSVTPSSGNNPDELYYPVLTVGKIYKAHDEGDYIRLKDDSGQEIYVTTNQPGLTIV